MKRFFGLLALALLTACATPPANERVAINDVHRVAVTQNKAVVVLGIAAPQSFTGALGGHPDLIAGWIKIDPSSGHRIGDTMIMMTERTGDLMPNATKAFRATQYRVYQLEPGHYALGWVYHVGIFNISSFASGSIRTFGGLGTQYVSNNFSKQAVIRPSTPVFDVHAGDILYAGDLILKFTQTNNERTIEISRAENADEARKSLPPELADKMAVRLWHYPGRD